MVLCPMCDIRSVEYDFDQLEEKFLDEFSVDVVVD